MYVCMHVCMSIGDGRQLDETKLDGWGESRTQVANTNTRQTSLKIVTLEGRQTSLKIVTLERDQVTARVKPSMKP